MFWAYLKMYAGWLGMLLLTGLVMSGVLLVNGVAAAEIAYGMGVCLVLTAIMLSAGYHRFRRKYRELERLERSIAVSLSDMTVPDTPIEAEYQELLRLLMAEKVNGENAAERRAKDFKEYFALWVHQIKTPISAMRLLLQEERVEENRAEEQEELFLIEQYVEMALQYIRLDSESTDFLLRETDLDPVIKEAVHKYARLFIRRKIKLDYTAVNVRAVTDEKWLAFVVEQLLANAIKYTPAGRIAIYAEDGNALVIEDSGIGIRAEDLPRVLEKGYTGYNGHGNEHSTGIGLYLCSQILKKLGHKISIASEEGKGTKVRIAFPEKLF
ncbi:MAG: sensor histidine kinase [Roseburia sp.]|nr:sensor histidine kinase [Roseburia sp.]